MRSLNSSSTSRRVGASCNKALTKLVFSARVGRVGIQEAAKVPSIARRHVAQATGDWGAADSQSAFDSRFTDAPSGLWESGLSGPLALDNSSPLIDEALAFGWRAQSKRQEEEGGDRSDGIFSWPHRPLQGSGGVQDLRHHAVFGSSDEEGHAPPMVASNAVPIEPRRHWVARTGVEAPEAENRLAVAAAMLAPHAGDAAAIDLPELPSRFEYLEPKHAEALAVAADILSKRAPSSPLSPPSPSPARAPAAARHLDEDLIGGVGPQPTPAAPRHARQYEAKAAEWLSTWDLDWLDMPTGPISDPASDLADEVRCFSSLRARTVKVGGSSSSKRLMGKDLDDLDKAFQHADAHVVSPLVNEGASAAVKVDRAAEAALRRVIRHQQEHDQGCRDSTTMP